MNIKTFLLLSIASATALANGPKPLEHQCTFSERGCLGTCVSKGPAKDQQFCQVRFKDHSTHQYPCGTLPGRDTCIEAPSTNATWPYSCRAYSQLDAATMCGVSFNTDGSDAYR